MVGGAELDTGVAMELDVILLASDPRGGSGEPADAVGNANYSHDGCSGMNGGSGEFMAATISQDLMRTA